MSANQASLPTPASYVPFDHRVLKGALAPGSALASATVIGEVIPIANVRYLTIRVLTATAGGTLNFDFVRPVATEPVMLSTDTGVNPAQVTKYTSPASPTAVAVTAGTQASLQVTCNGEKYGYVSITGGGTGTVSWVDVSAL